RQRARRRADVGGGVSAGHRAAGGGASSVTHRWRQPHWRGAASVSGRQQGRGQPTVLRSAVGTMARAEGPLAVQVLPIQVLPIEVGIQALGRGHALCLTAVITTKQMISKEKCTVC